MMNAVQSRRRQAGFTLLEVLAGLVLASLVLVSLNMAMSAVGKGVDRTRKSLGEQSEIGAAVDVFARDVGRIAKLRRGVDPQNFTGYLFDGRPDSMVYPLREEEGLTAPGLYLVRLSVQEDKGQRLLLRERAPIVASIEDLSLQPEWRDPVVLLSGDFDIAFAYRAQRTGAREWSGSWEASAALPEQVRLTITDRVSGKLRVPGYVQSLAIDSEPECAAPKAPRCADAAVTQ